MLTASLYRHRTVLVHLPIWALALVAFFWASHRWMPLPPNQVTITAGAQGGMYYEHAQRYAAALREHGINTQILTSEGTGQNLDRLLAQVPQADIGFVQGGYVASAMQNLALHRIEAIAQIDVEPIWVFSRFRDVDSLLRLQGTRIAIGPVGSGSRLVALQILEQVQLGVGDIMASDSVGQDAALAMQEGRIDAMIFVASANAPVVQRLLASRGVYLASLRQTAALIERLPQLEPRIVLAGHLHARMQQPARDTVLLSALASLVVNKELHPLMKRKLAHLATTLHAASGPLHHAGEFPHLKRLDFSVARQAREVIQGSLPWLETQLRPVQAQWLYRLLFIGLPILILGFLASQIVPSVLRWRLQQQINRWYGELKFIENDLADTDASGLRMARFRSELQRLNAQINAFTAPRAFQERLYHLKQHIHFVHSELARHQGR
jgi:uncharacterized protein